MIILWIFMYIFSLFFFGGGGEDPLMTRLHDYFMDLYLHICLSPNKICTEMYYLQIKFWMEIYYLQIKYTREI